MDGTPITANHREQLARMAEKLKPLLSTEGLLSALLQVNRDRCVPPLLDAEVKRIAGAGDWREKYHSQDEIVHCPPPVFFAEGFLEVDSITAIAGPSGARKSFTLASIMRAMVTGEPLFGHFPVTRQPERVIYLCPEMGVTTISDRFKRLGIAEHSQGKLFIASANTRPPVRLADLTAEELAGALVLLDTGARFIAGDENNTENVKAFADELFGLKAKGASVVVVYHAGKSGRDATDLTLENMVRGSSDLGAALDCCWGTNLVEPGEPFDSLARMVCVKQRNFEGKSFFLSCERETGACVYVPEAEAMVGGKDKRKPGPKKDEQTLAEDATAEAFLAANEGMGNRALSRELYARYGIKRGEKWFREARSRMHGTGVALSVCASASSP